MQFEMDVPDQLKGKIHFALGWLLEVLLSAKHLFTLKSTAHPSPPTPQPPHLFQIKSKIEICNEKFENLTQMLLTVRIKFGNFSL